MADLQKNKIKLSTQSIINKISRCVSKKHICKFCVTGFLS